MKRIVDFQKDGEVGRRRRAMGGADDGKRGKYLALIPGISSLSTP